MSDSIAYRGLQHSKHVGRQPAGFLPPVAVLSSTSYYYVDVLGGGQRIVYTVDSSAGCTAIKVGGVAFTSFAIDDATHVSGIPPAHASGVADVVVTNAGGDSTTGAEFIEFFDPTSIFDLYLDATNYAVGTWTARNGRNFTEATHPPIVGTAVNGRATVDFDGSNQSLLDSAGFTSYVTSTAYTTFCLFRPDAIVGANPPPATYDNEALFCENESAGDFSANLYNSGGQQKVQNYHYSAGDHADVTSIDLLLWNASFSKYDGTKVYSRIGYSSWDAGTAAGSLDVSANKRLAIGKNYNGVAFYNGRIAILGIGKTAVIDDTLYKFLGTIRQTWGFNTVFTPV